MKPMTICYKISHVAIMKEMYNNIMNLYNKKVILLLSKMKVRNEESGSQYFDSECKKPEA